MYSNRPKSGSRNAGKNTDKSSNKDVKTEEILNSKMQEIKLCLLGDSDVGKSCIAQHFVYGSFYSDLDPTIGAAFCSKYIQVGDVLCKFQIWDTAGMEKYKSLTPMYYRGSSAVIVVYDVTKDRTFESVKKWIEELKAHTEPDVLLCIAGNKSDLEDLKDVSSEDAKNFAQSQNAIFYETSAKSGKNINEMFREIAEKLSVIHRWHETSTYCIKPRCMSDLGTLRKTQKSSSSGTKKLCCVL